MWCDLLDEGDPERDYILEGVKYGFRIIEQDEDLAEDIEVDNYTSCAKYRDLVENQIQHEINNGQYVITQTKPRIVSALGAIPKSGSNIRLIHDASRPIDISLNDHIHSDCSCTYMDLKEAEKHVTPYCYMAKVDLSSAYRSVPIHPSSYQATGLKWKFVGDDKPTYMFDSRLPLGFARVPRFSRNLVVWFVVLLNKGLELLL